ncbi:SusD/RagB family nutrient-binding outer membrane lipoprotein [Empedobacter tilapiae]
MKKILLGLAVVFAFNSCTDEEYDRLNHDPMNPEKVPGSYLVTGATTSYFNRMMSTNVNSNIFRLVAQQWNETEYTTETNYDLDGRKISDNLWNEIAMNVLYDLNEAKKMIEADVTLIQTQKKNQLAIADLLQVQAWQVMVDTYGNIPYSEALKGADNISPKYDDAKSIYEDLIKRVNDNINNIDVNAPGFVENDIIYTLPVGGEVKAHTSDMKKWKKFAASLQLKLGIQLSDSDPNLAKTTVENAVKNGVFTSQADNFTLFYTGSEPYTNPLWIDLVKGGRRDFVAANTIIDYMNDLKDPRRGKYFKENLGEGVFVGGTYGQATAFNSFTQISATLESPSYPGTLLDYTEVQFMLAEAAARGFAVGGTAESFYNSGIMASFEFWGNTTSEASVYLAQPNVAYTTASGTWKEKIGKQYWLAMYNKGFDGWTAWRRLDAPKLNLPLETKTPVPMRYTYPISEKNLNGANNSAAAAAIGGDKLDTKLFWDKF